MLLRGDLAMVMLRVTVTSIAGGAAMEEEEEEGEKEENLRSLPRPDSGRGPATVSSHSLSEGPFDPLFLPQLVQ
ncbi:hypothetical protein ACMD2_17571 [Ananas comosus]|uniref:Uncharacterized protein n=1 Tax=Ananas comosus TaxID=4615 RepID=A0A199UN94_ANACO|nr:hypothetical protein ACMD2_17571 [Ananas comosus]